MGLTQTRIFTKKIFDNYAKEFGERKALKLIENVYNSNTIIETLKIWYKQNYIPTYQDFQKAVGTINWFVFSKRETTAVGMIIMLAKWDEQINSRKKLLTETQTIQIAYNTLTWLKFYIDELLEFKLSTEHSFKNNPISVIINNLLTGSYTSVKGIKYAILNDPAESLLKNIQIPHSTLNIASYVGDELTGGTWNHILPFFFEKSAQYNKFSFDKDIDYSIEVTGALEVNSDRSGAIFSLSLPSRIRTPIKPTQLVKQSFHCSCVIDANGISFIHRATGWMLLLGGNVDEWEVS
ncbi:hypothetical protein FY528_13890 [Hymenobacter lutimineralis]|uniref:Uncharacterized protein n=1 Tax=Hymenobacter lutimineralis TaxID=2606448 RepID=A0A5D6V038_9BACT|nr:hypothetical protein [Hymenobacter lutimineralis]TYZ08129.1 hypothetical protein FY528_13890 [Hymenobacter lutimineralis]